MIKKTSLRPPSVPLVACDPYFSIWSPADNLYDTDTTHWTGKKHRLFSSITVDGTTYRLMGTNPDLPLTFTQKSLSVLPTRTIYNFEEAGIALTLTFMTPALPEDIAILSRPVTYVTYDLYSIDGKNHNVSFVFHAYAEITVNHSTELTLSSKENIPGLLVLKSGSKDQKILEKRGDDLRINWGYFYLATSSDIKGTTATIHSEKGEENGEIEGPGNSIFSSLDFATIEVGKEKVTRWLMVAYDDLYSIQYMKKNLRPYWRRNGWEGSDLLSASAKEYDSLKKRCEKFDDELTTDCINVGGENYGLLCALSYRQCFAAGKFTSDDNGQPLQFCKENDSNGCISTSDVFYPMAPQFLFLSPSLVKSFLVPFMDYAASQRWKFPFAPHDLGTYPKANGQIYGGGERDESSQMPVEESGNLLILFAALAHIEGNADFAGLYWKQLEQWAEYLKEKGFDPENQLCTDDFAGHLAHNVNLSVKAICGLGSFAYLCAKRGNKERSEEFFKTAREFALKLAIEADDGDHYRLAYNKPGSWSQKYNMIWDRILGLNLFPKEFARKEMDYYKKIQNRYGLQLDNRETYTKLDWITWTATITENREDFEALINPIITFINETEDRFALTDWYQTETAKKVGFTARPVVGGVFARMLYEEKIWEKYSSCDKTHAKDWAPMPKTKPLTPELIIFEKKLKDAGDHYWYNKETINKSLSDKGLVYDVILDLYDDIKNAIDNEAASIAEEKMKKLYELYGMEY